MMMRYCLKTLIAIPCKTSRSSCSLSNLGQGCRIIANLQEVRKCTINITTGWQDHCDIFCSYDTYPRSECNWHTDPYPFEPLSMSDIQSRSNDSFVQGVIRFSASSDRVLNIFPIDSSAESIYISVKVPEYFDFEITANELDLIVRNKFQGNFSVHNDSGTIVIDKMRGSNITIDSGSSHVSVRKLLEGNCTISAGQLGAKMINGDLVSINTVNGGVDIEAMYAKTASVVCNSDGNINIGLLQGAISTETKGHGSTTVSNIDGSFDILAQEGEVKLQINKLDLSSPSSAVAVKGNISAKIDGEVAATLLCETTTGSSSGRKTLSIASDSYVSYVNTFDYENPVNSKNIPPKAQWIAALPAPLTGHRLAGRLTGPTAGKVRHSGGGAASSGKISTASAEEQSLRTFEKKRLDSSDRENIDIQLRARGSVRVETLSWMEVIRRKYGFTEKSEGTSPPSIKHASVHSSVPDVGF